MMTPRQSAIDDAREKARKLIRGPLVGCSDGDTYLVRVPSETMLTAALLRAEAKGMRELLDRVRAMIEAERVMRGTARKDNDDTRAEMHGDRAQAMTEIATHIASRADELDAMAREIEG